MKNKPSEIFRLEDELTSVQNLSETTRKSSIGTAFLMDKFNRKTSINLNDLYGPGKRVNYHEINCLSTCLRGNQSW